MSAYPRATSRASSEPGSASKPVCRIAVFALLVPVPTSGPASRRTVRSSKPARARATATPTTPAPITATSSAAGMPLPSQLDRPLEPLQPALAVRGGRPRLHHQTRGPIPQDRLVVLPQAGRARGQEADPAEGRLRVRGHLERNAQQVGLHLHQRA